MKVLDCESIESTYKSLEAILGVKKSRLCQLFDSINVYEEMHESTSDFLFSYIRDETDCKADFDKTCWFHCTRTLKSNSFKEGILPLKEVIPKIWDFLFDLSEGQLTRKQWADLKRFIDYSQYHYANLYRMKWADVKLHGGPHALLIREDAIGAAKSSTYWNYFEIPEIVDDICYCCVDKCGIDLTHKFITSTVPCIVKFIDYKANIGALRTAMIYAYLKHRNLDLLPDSNLCFSAEGVPVPKEKILNVEFLSDREIKTVRKDIKDINSGGSVNIILEIE